MGFRGAYLEGIHLFLCEAGRDDCVAEAAEGDDGGMNRHVLSDRLGFCLRLGLLMIT